jgi:hypothetical protein
MILTKNSSHGFQFLGTSNRTKHNKARRNSGGITLFVKSAIAKGKSFFHLRKDIYIATIYISLE